MTVRSPSRRAFFDYLIEVLEKGSSRLWRDVFFRKVDVGFEVGNEVEELIAQLSGGLAKVAFELFVSGLDGEVRGGSNEVHDGLCLSEI